METLAAVVLVLICIAVAIFVYQSLKPKPLPSVPHNSDLSWFSGDIPFVARIVKETGFFTKPFERMADKFGPISQLVFGSGSSWVSKWIGFGNISVILSDSQEIHDILANRMAEFDRSYLTTNLFYATVPYSMVSMLTTSQFKHHRRWLGLSMSAPYLARMIPRMTEIIMELVQLWSLSSERLRAEGSNERAFSAINDLHLASIDVMASITFGASFDSIRAAVDTLESDPQASASKRPEKPALSQALERLFEVMGSNTFFPFPPLLTWWTRTFNTKWIHARNLLYGFLGRKLDKAREEYVALGHDKTKPQARLADNVLDMVLEKEKEDLLRGEIALSSDEILDELASYALAGSDTTATSLQWSVKFMTQHPEVQHKLRKELMNNLPPPGQRMATYEELSNTERLPYLSAVVYEVLRVSRTAAAVLRDTTRDTTILGHPIPKGTTVVFLLAYAQQYESEAYKPISDGLDGVRSESSRRSGRKHGYWAEKDCAEFRPERWLTADGAFDPNAGPWMPFGGGIRGCFGQKLAILELRMFLAMIHSTFFFDEVPEELNDLTAWETITTHPTQCYVRPIPWSEIES